MEELKFDELDFLIKPTTPEPTDTLLNEVYESDEYENWMDKGCELHPTCLNCPYPQCKYDFNGGKATLRKLDRATKIRCLSRLGDSQKSLASQFGCSVRTVQRALAENPTHAH